MPQQSVTQILQRLRSCNADAKRAAENELWQQFVGPMRRIARSKMRGGGWPVADEEDVAISVFRVFFKGVRDGRFDSLVSSGQTQALLTRLTIDKTIDLIRFHKAQRRCPVEKSYSTNEDGTPGSRSMVARSPLPLHMQSQMADKREYPADAIAEWKDELNRLIVMLSEQTLQQIVTLKLQGYSNDEIAAELGCVTRTVERKLQMIRKFWGPIMDRGGHRKDQKTVPKKEAGRVG